MVKGQLQFRRIDVVIELLDHTIGEGQLNGMVRIDKDVKDRDFAIVFVRIGR